MKTAKLLHICRYCGGKVRKGRSREIYEKGDQPIYICTNCNAYVLCHKDTGLPMGKLANAVLRLKRRETHEVFDEFWKARGWSRSEAYQWLAQSMKISESEAHIANFEMDECAAVIILCRKIEREEVA